MINEVNNMSGISKGLAIGMSICVLGAIALSEIWGYHEVYTLSIIFGSALGVILGTVFEIRDKNRVYAK